MIIGVDASALGNRVTGTSRYIECLLKELQNTNHTIKTFSHSKIADANKVSLLNSLPIIKRGGIRRHIFRKFELNKQMMNSRVNYGIFPNYLMPIKFKRPAAIIIHDLSFISHPHFYSKAFVWYYKDQLKKVLKSNPFVCAVSETTRKSIVQYLGVDKNKIFLLQAYADIERIGAGQYLHNSKDGRPYFLYVGHIEPRKNLFFMIENFLSWKKKSRSEYKLKLVGEIWSSSKKIQDMIKYFSKELDVEFCGYVEENQLSALYSNASAFIHTSFIEGFGFPVLEAMHYGLPILCSAGTGTDEISKPYAITINPFDKSSLVNGFDRLAAAVKHCKENYLITYSPRLMREQLDLLLNAMEHI